MRDDDEPPYYNTTGLSGRDLVEAKLKAGSQDATIYWWMKERPSEAFTRDEIHMRVLPKAQNTSITRALNTLMKKGLIEKLPLFRLGRMGAKQHLWRYLPAIPKNETMEMFR